ncbi:MAG: hypothetical protein IPM27_11820 [Nitrosomonadales bacterium]|nr:hypothetical protein [Nitrosomonadales bacterium]
MFAEILAKLAFPDLGEYAANCSAIPVGDLVWPSSLPAGILSICPCAVYHARKTRPEHFRDALLIAALNFLPPRSVPHSGVRYLMPIYPLFALIAPRLIWRAGAASIDVTPAGWLPRSHST